MRGGGQVLYLPQQYRLWILPASLPRLANARADGVAPRAKCSRAALAHCCVAFAADHVVALRTVG